MPRLHVPRVTEEEIGASASADLAGWLVFQVAASHIALPILIATYLLSKTVSAHPAVVTLCITWVLSGVFGTLLFYVGQHKGPEPSRGLCVAQASLYGSAPTMTCSALFLLAYRLWRTWDNGVGDAAFESRRQKLLKMTIYLVPFIVFGLFVAVAVNVRYSSLHVSRSEITTQTANREQRFFYCSLDFSQLSDAVQVIATIMCVASVILQADIAAKASHYWHAVRNRNHLTDDMLSLLVRTAVFTLYVLVSTLVNLISIWVPMGVVPDMLSASVGMALFLIFVSQRAIFEAWSFWKRPRMHEATRTVSLPHSNADEYQFTPPPKRRYRAYRDRTSSSLESSSVPSLAGIHALDSLKDFRYDESPSPTAGVQIIRRPEEAFRSVKAKPDKRDRSTISTWGF